MLNCEVFLKETKMVCCLPYKEGDKIKTRWLKNGERIRGKNQTGPRGGKFFTIIDRDLEGEICTIKIYLPRI